MIRVLLISLLAMITFSCKTKKIVDLPQKPYEKVETVIENSYFATIGEEHIFRAHVKVFKSELSGLMVVKRIDEDHHRVVLTSDFGNTLFDFSIYPNHFLVNYAMKDLDKKIILNLLAKDFQLFTATEIPVSKLAVQGTNNVYTGRYNTLKTVVVWDNTAEQVTRLLYGKPKRAKVSYAYGFKEDEKGTLSIEHYNFPLRITLTPLAE